MPRRLLLGIVLILSLLPTLHLLPLITEEEAADGRTIEQKANEGLFMLQKPFRSCRILTMRVLLTEISTSCSHDNAISGDQCLMASRQILADPALCGEISDRPLPIEQAANGGLIEHGANKGLLMLQKPFRSRRILANPALLTEISSNCLQHNANYGDQSLMTSRRILREISSGMGLAPAPENGQVQKKSKLQKLLARFHWISHVGFFLGCIYNLLNWYLIVRFATDSRAQCRWNLAALLTGALPTSFITKAHSLWRDGWQATKVLLNASTTYLGVYGEAAVYRNDRHDVAALVFWAIELLGFVCCMTLGKTEEAVHVIRMIQLATGLASALIQLVAFFLYRNWEFVTFEAYAAVLGSLYAFADVVDSDGHADQMALILLTAFIRFSYGICIVFRSHTQGVLALGLMACFGELNNFNTRSVRSFQECWQHIRALTQICAQMFYVCYTRGRDCCYACAKGCRCVWKKLVSLYVRSKKKWGGNSE